MFLYVDASKGTLTRALRSALEVMEGQDLYDGLANLSRTANGYITIYGVIDHYDQWHQDDVLAMAAIVLQAWTNFRIHIPTISETVVKKVDFNGGVKASCLGWATPTLRHQLLLFEAREFANAITQDIDQYRQNEIMVHVLVHFLAKKSITPREICEISDTILHSG